MLHTSKTKQFCETSSKNVTGRHDPTRHESAIYIAGTILKLQNTMKFQRQLIHQQHLQSHLQCGNHPGVAKGNGIPSTARTQETGESSSYNGSEGQFEHDPRMTRGRSATVVPQSLTCQARSQPPFVLKKHSISCVRYLSKIHFVRDFLPKCTLNTCKTKPFCETSFQNAC